MKLSLHKDIIKFTDLLQAKKVFCFKNCADLSLFDVLVFLDQLNNCFSQYVRTNFRNKVPKISVKNIGASYSTKCLGKKVWRAILLKLCVLEL